MLPLAGNLFFDGCVLAERIFFDRALLDVSISISSRLCAGQSPFSCHQGRINPQMVLLLLLHRIRQNCRILQKKCETLHRKSKTLQGSDPDPAVH